MVSNVPHFKVLIFYRLFDIFKAVLLYLVKHLVSLFSKGAIEIKCIIYYYYHLFSSQGGGWCPVGVLLSFETEVQASDQPAKNEAIL